MKRLAILGVISLAGLVSQTSNAAVVSNYDTLSTIGASPTALTFTVGDNIINARLLPTPASDSRFFSFTVASGYQLSSITLDAYSSAPLTSGSATAGGIAFFGIKQGLTITPDTTNPSSVDGFALLGTSTDTSTKATYGVDSTLVGQDLFTSLIASGARTGTTLTNSLGSGDYTVWLRESKTNDDFSLTFKVTSVPVPATVWLMGSALLGLVGFNKRRIKSF